jgi:hypothetical protein
MKKLINKIKSFCKTAPIPLGEIKQTRDMAVINSMPIINESMPVLSQLCGVENIVLNSFLKEDFTKLFGKHNTIFIGEFRYYVWILEFEGETFQVFTANTKGTSYEAAKHSLSKEAIYIRFLKKIKELITKQPVN